MSTASDSLLLSTCSTPEHVMTQYILVHDVKPIVLDMCARCPTVASSSWPARRCGSWSGVVVAGRIRGRLDSSQNDMIIGLPARLRLQRAEMRSCGAGAVLPFIFTILQPTCTPFLNAWDPACTLQITLSLKSSPIDLHSNGRPVSWVEQQAALLAEP